MPYEKTQSKIHPQEGDKIAVRSSASKHIDEHYNEVASELQNLFEDSIRTLEDVTGIISQQRLEISEAKSISSSTQTQIQQLQAQLKSVNKQLRLVEADLQREKTAKDALQGELAGVTKRLESAMASVAEELEENVNQEKMLATLRGQVANDNKTKKELGLKLGKFKEEARNERILREALEATVEKLTRTIQDQDSDILTLATELKSFKKPTREMEIQCDILPSSLEQEVENLREMLGTKAMELERSQADVKALKEELTATSRDRESARSESSWLKQQLDEATHRLISFAVEKEAMVAARVQQVCDGAKRTQAQNLELYKELDRLQNELSRLTESSRLQGLRESRWVPSMPNRSRFGAITSTFTSKSSKGKENYEKPPPNQNRPFYQTGF